MHARPYIELSPPERVSYLAPLVDREDRLREFDHLRLLCEHFRKPVPDHPQAKDFFLGYCGRLRESHHGNP
ncbi:MAG: DUF3422 family protein [Methylococcaceae bacterium]|nr:DUF3422 family protein [Methylococcaceae bacterium]